MHNLMVPLVCRMARITLRSYGGEGDSGLAKYFSMYSGHVVVAGHQHGAGIRCSYGRQELFILVSSVAQTRHRSRIPATLSKLRSDPRVEAFIDAGIIAVLDWEVSVGERPRRLPGPLAFQGKTFSPLTPPAPT